MATSSISGSLAAQAQSAALNSRVDSEIRQIQSQQGAKSDGKIEKSAREFESMLLSTWLQQAEQSMATVPGAEDDEDKAGRDQMMGMGVQALASSLSASGGIGIAAMIAKALHSKADKLQEVAGSGAPAKAMQMGK